MKDSLFIPGPAGPLEARLELPDTLDSTAPLAVLCHPHPLYGGSLTNKVVHMMAAAWRAQGAITLRFNFRGVGRSAGQFDNAQGEVEDLRAVVAWGREQYPQAPLWLGGFSFGAYIALQAQAGLQPERLLLVAPPLSLYPASGLPPVETPWQVIQGSEDEVIDAAQVRAWVAQQTHNPPEFTWLEGASHFFHGRLNDLREKIEPNVEGQGPSHHT